MATVTSISYLFRSTGSVIGLCGSQAIFNGLVKYLLTERIQGNNAAEVRTTNQEQKISGD
jgi:hypothetical protein